MEANEREFMTGQTFRILNSTLMSMPNGDYVSAKDIKDAMNRYGIKFDVTFKAFDWLQQLKREAKDSYIASEAVKLYNNAKQTGQGIKLSGNNA